MNTEWAGRGLCIKWLVRCSFANENNNATGTSSPANFFLGGIVEWNSQRETKTLSLTGRWTHFVRPFAVIILELIHFCTYFDLISWDSRLETRLMYFVVILGVKDVRRKALNPRECWSQHGRLRSLTTGRFFVRTEARDLLVARWTAFLITWMLLSSPEFEIFHNRFDVIASSRQ